MHALCGSFNGIVLIDEAYAEFADSDCMHFVKGYPNVIVIRTLSKSYSLAGIRLGYAAASEAIISGMMKVKDSYNVNALTQKIAAAAMRDREHFRNNIRKICETRRRLTEMLSERGFSIIPSQANFIFASPPDGDGENLYRKLKDNGILVRWFAGEVTGRFVRITIGTDKETDTLIKNIDFIKTVCKSGK
jgi:histidinol-phosphate aminotransferase